MQPSLSLFNWSLPKLLASHADAFTRAKVKILFWVLLLSLAKILVALAVSWHAGQSLQLQRGVLLLFLYIFLLKGLLANKKYLKPITHLMLGFGVLLIWSNVLLYAQSLNVISIQFISMLILSSYYLLTARFAVFYCALSLVPVVMHLVFKNHFSFSAIQPDPIASPGYEILIILNFITIVLSHYLFKQAFINNLAEKKALNLQLQDALKEANLAAESKMNFLSTMSHELRTPLNAVIGISELLLSEAHTKEQAENLSILRFSAGNLHALINDVLDFNKLGLGKLGLESIPVDLYQLLQDLGRGFRIQAQQKGIGFDLDIDEALTRYWVVTDPTRITQIVNNLAGNAIKFTSQGRVSLGLRVLQAGQQELTIKMFIADTGIGISEEKQEAIFEPFTQASSSTTRNFGGTGLGLAIVKKLLTLFNSAIKLESTPGSGSTFSFDLVLPLSPALQRTIAPVPEADDDLDGLRILVAEDNPMNRLLLSKIFSKWNVHAVYVFNGQEALEKLIQEDFDVILMDLHMPVLDGYEASRMIRSLSDPVKAGVSIIALTASESANLHEKIHRAGLNGFILKPFKRGQLYNCLKEQVLSRGKYAEG